MLGAHPIRPIACGVAGSPLASLTFAVFAIPSPVRHAQILLPQVN